MMKTPPTKTATPDVPNTAPTTAPQPGAAVEAKLAKLRAENSQAVQDLAAAFGAERWAALVRQCEAQGMDAAAIASLCGKMCRTRREWHPKNAPAALQGACNGFLCAVGSVPTEADIKAFEAALQPDL